MIFNVGTSDRYIRVISGILIIAAGAYYGSYWGVIGFVPLLTGLGGMCLIYIPFGISTKQISDTLQDKEDKT